MGYHAELAQKKRAERSVQAMLDAEAKRHREAVEARTAQRRAEEAARLAEHLHAMVRVAPEAVVVPPGTGSVDLPILKVWTRPERLRRKAFSCGNVLEMWHGTKHPSLASIAKNGLRRGSSTCLFGSGIYLSRDITKALNYGQSYESYLPGYGYGMQSTRSVTLLRCAVATGTALNAHTEAWRSELHHVGPTPKHRYNSLYAPNRVLIDGVIGGALRGEEWVVYDPSQVEILEVYFWTQEAKPVVVPVVKPVVRVPAAPSKQRIGAKSALMFRRRTDTKGGEKEVLARHHCCVKSTDVCRHAKVQRDRNGGWEQLCAWFGMSGNGYKTINVDKVGLGVLRPFCTKFSPF